MNPATYIVLTVALLAPPTVRDDEGVSVSEAKKNGDGVLVHEVRSPSQAKATQIRVLQPDKIEKGKSTRSCMCCRSKAAPGDGTGTA